MKYERTVIKTAKPEDWECYVALEQASSVDCVYDTCVATALPKGPLYRRHQHLTTYCNTRQ